MIIKKKWKTSLLGIFIISISHPFTGIELLSILGAWLFVEKLIIRNTTIPWYFAIGTGCILAFHVYYYLYYLNQFPDHKSVSEQFSVNWRLRFFSMIPAYAIVAPLAFLSIFKFSKPKQFFQNSHNRLFLCWLIVVLLLANHELEDCDDILDSLDETKITPAVIASVLTITAGARSVLTERSGFYKRAQDHLNGIRGSVATERLLVGLA